MVQGSGSADTPRTAGNRLRWALAHLTGNRLYGVTTGAGVTKEQPTRPSP